LFSIPRVATKARTIAREILRRNVTSRVVKNLT
jgi:hypothetical protein